MQRCLDRALETSKKDTIAAGLNISNAIDHIQPVVIDFSTYLLQFLESSFGRKFF